MLPVDILRVFSAGVMQCSAPSTHTLQNDEQTRIITTERRLFVAQNNRSSALDRIYDREPVISAE